MRNNDSHGYAINTAEYFLLHCTSISLRSFDLHKFKLRSSDAPKIIPL